MAEAAVKKSVGGFLAGWVKAVLTGVMGLLTGAVIMYISPIVDRVVKPPKPLANFGIEVDGRTVKFVNQAEGSDGWWDFGDGTPLQPFAVDQKVVSHEYIHPGGYTAKLTLRNVIGEENHREVNVHVDGTSVKPAAIEQFDVQPLVVQPGDTKQYAPATFKINAKVTNADLCVWACGTDHPLEVVTDPPESQERYVTFAQPGRYIIKLAAVQGKQTIEKTQVVMIDQPVIARPLAMVSVINQATRFKSMQREHAIKLNFPANNQAPTVAFSQEMSADPGCQIMAADFAQSMPAFIQNAKVTIAPDGNKLVVTGEYVRAKAKPEPKGAMPNLTVPVNLTQHRSEKAMSVPVEPMWKPLQINGTTYFPLPKPSGWKVQGQQVRLQLFDGGTAVWQDTKLPQKSTLFFHGQPYIVTATVVNDQLKIDMIKS
jgi:hypothetical protein